MNRGTTLIETIFYILLVVLILSVIVNTLFSLGGLYKGMQASKAVQSTAEIALERMTRETRDSLSIDTGGSVFNSASGELSLNTTDSSGNPLNIEFYLLNGEVRMKISGVDVGSLTPSRANVTSLIFRQITTPQSQAVKIEMSVESGQGESYKSKTFYSTIVLRGSYPLQ